MNSPGFYSQSWNDDNNDERIEDYVQDTSVLWIVRKLITPIANELDLYFYESSKIIVISFHFERSWAIPEKGRENKRQKQNMQTNYKEWDGEKRKG